MEAKILLPQLNEIPIDIGNQNHTIYTDLDKDMIGSFIALWLLENKGAERSDYTLSSLLHYVKKNSTKCILLSKKQYNMFLKNLSKYELYED
jgi:hypothetical protein